MKVRIGVGVSSVAGGDDELGGIASAMERLGFDSIWLPEILTMPGGDPVAGLSFVAARVNKLKLGTTMVLPGRNPVRLAKQLATLDRLSCGRLLVTFVLGLAQPGELAALDVQRGERGAIVDEALPLLRRLWAEDLVSHEGRWALQGISVEPKPLQEPLEAWLGGTAPSACARAGRLADGWLPSMCTPAEAARGRSAVEEAAASAGRRIDPEHYGVSIGYLHEDAPEGIAEAVVHRLRRRGGPVAQLVPTGFGALRALVSSYLDAGFSKFVLRPVVAPGDWTGELERLAEGVLDLQS
jgi:probable F420-dependent oxidoreductase